MEISTIMMGAVGLLNLWFMALIKMIFTRQDKAEKNCEERHHRIRNDLLAMQLGVVRKDDLLGTMESAIGPLRSQIVTLTTSVNHLDDKFERYRERNRNEN